MFYLFDPVYLLFVGPAMLLSLIATVKVKSSMARYQKVPVRSGMSGGEVARAILDRNGLRGVQVEPSRGYLSDHYDPRSRTVRLSPDVYSGRSVTALGVAAHEVGHAIQHKENYAPMALRQLMVPVASFGSNFAWILLIAGMFLHMASLVNLGLVLFGVAVAFTVVTLPVEFDASRRAKKLLPEFGFVTGTDESKGVSAVLSAAAMTYVAAAVAAIAQLLYFLLRAGVLGGSDD